MHPAAAPGGRAWPVRRASRRSRALQRLRPVLLVLPLALAGCHRVPVGLAGAGEALRSCPGTPNCVSTEAADRRHAMAPLPFQGSARVAQARAKAALLQEPRTRIVEEQPGYLRAEARSRVFRFVDDVEVLVDSSAKLVRFRSASRVGRSDLGVNRARMERFSQRFRALDETAEPVQQARRHVIPCEERARNPA
jgi:uncharacterized protein (DUF1499 family)